MPQRIDQLDIVKGISMIMIILCHYSQNFSSTFELFSYLQMGCSVFFVCSGFGVAILINNKYISSDLKIDAKSFYISRIKKLIPPWVLAILIVYIANSIALRIFGTTLYFGTERSFFGIVVNAFLLHGFFPTYNNTVMPGGWFVGALIILYFLSPLLIYLFNKTNKKKQLSLVILLLSVFVWIIMSFTMKNFNYNSYPYFVFVNHLPSFCLGILAYYEVNKQSSSLLQIIIGILLVVISVFYWYNINIYTPIIVNWLVAFATHFLLIYIINRKINLSKFRVLKAYGKNTYCIYLLHAFSVFTLISLIKRVLPFDIDNIYCYIFIFPIVLLSCFYVGKLFNFVTNIVVSTISNKLINKK